MPDSIPDDPDADLVAFLDGELDARATRGMEKRLRADSKLRAQAEAIRKTWNLLDFLPHPEPSPSFTSRTLDKVAVLRPASVKSEPVPALTASQPRPMVASPNPGPWRRRGGWVVAAAAALFVVGFLASAPLGRKKAPESVDRDEQIAQDLSVLDNLNLYQYGDDLAFLFGLDQPDLFGDDSSGR